MAKKNRPVTRRELKERERELLAAEIAKIIDQYDPSVGLWALIDAVPQHIFYHAHSKRYAMNRMIRFCYDMMNKANKMIDHYDFPKTEKQSFQAIIRDVNRKQLHEWSFEAISDKIAKKIIREKANEYSDAHSFQLKEGAMGGWIPYLIKKKR